MKHDIKRAPKQTIRMFVFHSLGGAAWPRIGWGRVLPDNDLSKTRTSRGSRVKAVKKAAHSQCRLILGSRFLQLSLKSHGLIATAQFVVRKGSNNSRVGYSQGWLCSVGYVQNDTRGLSPGITLQLTFSVSYVRYSHPYPELL